MSGVELLFLDNRGVYIPQNFAEELRTDWLHNVEQEDLDILAQGPDYEWYWETWDRVLNNAYYEDDNGNIWRFWQDGDVWMYCEELMTEEEKHNLFGSFNFEEEEIYEY